MTTQDFEFLYKENASKMIGYCCRNYFNIDAESVVQDAFNIIWKKREASNSNSNSFAWFTFKNVLMTALRSNRRRLIREDHQFKIEQRRRS
jgi:DNA-directed RNA polymerase specialized sigma24 family protein